VVIYTYMAELVEDGDDGGITAAKDLEVVVVP